MHNWQNTLHHTEDYTSYATAYSAYLVICHYRSCLLLILKKLRINLDWYLSRDVFSLCEYTMT